MSMKEIIRKFIETEDMAECFCTHYSDISKHIYPWCKTITSSRASLQDKIDALNVIAKHSTTIVDEEDFFFYNPKILIEAAQAALTETQNKPLGSIFILGEYRRKDDWNKTCKEYHTPCLSFEQATNILKKKFDTGDYSNKSKDEVLKTIWFDITRWDLNKDGMFEEAIIWDLKDSETICGFWINEDSNSDFDKIDEYDCFWATYDDPSFRVPFQSGDVVLVDMQPHYTPFPAVITNPEWDDMVDCCYPQVAYINEDGQIETNALKHLPYKYPRYSPLYRLEKYKGILEGKFKPLQVIADILIDPNLISIKNRRVGTFGEFIYNEEDSD